MKLFISHLLSILTVISCSVPSEKDTLIVTRQAAEFEPLEAIWLIWPKTDYKKGESVQHVTISLIEALIEENKVVVTCSDKELLNQANEILNKQFPNSKNLTILEIPSYDIWARDMGPIFVETNQKTMAIADFNFNTWGYSDTLDADNKIEETFDEKVAEYFDLQLISSSVISEGGNREVNGKGVLMTTESVEQGRNPEMSKNEMEAEYKRLMGIEKTIWLKQGVVEDNLGNVGEGLGQLLAISDFSGEFYGSVSDEIKNATAPFNPKFYSFFHGL